MTAIFVLVLEWKLYIKTQNLILYWDFSIFHKVSFPTVDVSVVVCVVSSLVQVIWLIPHCKLVLLAQAGQATKATTAWPTCSPIAVWQYKNKKSSCLNSAFIYTDCTLPHNVTNSIASAYFLKCCFWNMIWFAVLFYSRWQCRVCCPDHHIYKKPVEKLLKVSRDTENKLIVQKALFKDQIFLKNTYFTHLQVQ